LMPEQFSDGKTIGVGFVHTLSSSGYTLSQAQAKWPLTQANYAGGITLSMSLDFVAWQEMSYTAKSQGGTFVTSPGGKYYYFNNTLQLPDLVSPRSSRSSILIFIVDLNGSGLRNNSGGEMILVYRYPADQTVAMQMVNQQIVIRNGMIRGSGSKTVNDIGIRIGASTRTLFENMKFDNCGIGLDLQFCLETTITNCNVYAYGVYGMRIWNGQWTGAANSNAQSNIVTITGFRAYNGGGYTPIAAIYMNGNHTIWGNTMTFEGDKGSQSHIFYENTGGTGVNVFCLNNNYMEYAGCSRAAIRIRSGKGQYVINQLRSSVVESDMPCLIEADNNFQPTSVLHVMISNSTAATNKGKFRAVGLPTYPVKWYVTNYQMQNNTTFNSPENFDTSQPNTYIPGTNDFRFVKPL